MKNKYILGIDTSNYKTSVAITDMDGNVICDLRKFLNVKQGEKGLRQSDALFQHIRNLPDLIETAVERIKSGGSYELAAVSCSSRPRPVSGSYMPVFTAGTGYGRSLASVLGVPYFEFSHQEGHIEAVREFSERKNADRLIACHFSGGTSELLDVRCLPDGQGYDIDIIGGSLDIAFGQVIDRAGVALGLGFPAGEEMDRLASETTVRTDMLTPIKVDGCRLNLSGIDTQLKRLIEKNAISVAEASAELFARLADAMAKMIINGVELTGVRDVIMAGGVTSSAFIRDILKTKFENAGIKAGFSHTDLAQDNAVGIALLGGKRYGSKTCKGITA